MPTDIETLLGPRDTDTKCTPDEQLRTSLICRTDSYKFAHPFAYDDGITAMTSYGEARVGHDQVIVPFGMQMLLQRYLMQRITMADVDAAERFAEAHFGRQLFAREAWERVVRDHGGRMPVTIRAVPEGTPIRGGQPIYTVTAFGRELFWLSSALETLIQRGVWYPTTVATRDYALKCTLRQLYEETGADMATLPFALHDFGGRGVTSAEQAEIGGAAHLVNFMGSDTVEGVLAANHHYREPMAAYSVYATEHSVECSFGAGSDGALRYLRHQLRNAPRGSILSVVIDGYDVFREAELLCTTLRNEVLESGARVVFRPDSGDMMEVVPRILRLQEAAFGSDTNTRGYRKVRTVGIIQGDGVDHDAIRRLLLLLKSEGYSADSVIFGSGGALLQRVNRDTLKFAQKASAIRREDGTWVGVAKDPVTDSGKRSKEGVLTLARSRLTGELMTVRLDQGPLDAELEDTMRLVYCNGQLYNGTTLAAVRARCAL